MKIDNDAVWQDVKNGKYLGLSIEGIFSDKKQEDMSAVEDMTEEEAKILLQEIKDYLENESKVL